MRLYSKLLVMMLIACSLQRHLLASGELKEIWFGVRCDIAYVTHDDDLLGQLIAEIHDRESAEHAGDLSAAFRVNAAGG